MHILHDQQKRGMIAVSSLLGVLEVDGIDYVWYKSVFRKTVVDSRAIGTLRLPSCEPAESRAVFIHMSKDVNHIKAGDKLFVELLPSQAVRILGSQTRMTVTMMQGDVEIPNEHQLKPSTLHGLTFLHEEMIELALPFISSLRAYTLTSAHPLFISRITTRPSESHSTSLPTATSSGCLTKVMTPKWR
ncbi:hypothetical protein CERSUDRAFT_91481 [Gelatoporia subvermispora B]|uniref:Uncharacterized protein n=1 Tax=Ceriporiopsis subvermispora (strain B) TaxID=914234 RepID=M2QUJ6_CERS8|nr:hypothetical protein CERSUDRAFT_91481 [Gelatoporia subvermispora B]